MANLIGDFVKSLRAGKPAYSCFCWAPDAMVVEAVARAGFDAVVLDQQHGEHDARSMIHSITTAALAGKPAFIRCGMEDYTTSAKLLDAGAAGIMAPMINNAQDARRFVSFVKYPPHGGRSWGPNRTTALSGLAGADYLHAANGQTLALAMIETREGLNNLDEILAVEGIDGIQMGPSDLCISLTNGASVDSFHKDVDAAQNHVLARCKHAKKLACNFAVTPESAGDMIKRGYHMVSVGTDLMGMRAGLADHLARAQAAAR